MTRKTTTATTQPKMRGKMGHKKLVFFIRCRNNDHSSFQFCGFHLLLSTIQYYVPSNAILNHVNTFLGHIIWALH